MRGDDEESEREKLWRGCGVWLLEAKIAAHLLLFLFGIGKRRKCTKNVYVVFSVLYILLYILLRVSWIVYVYSYVLVRVFRLVPFGLWRCHCFAPPTVLF